MEDHQDAYGYELWDYFHGEESPEIIEREDGYVGASDGPKMYFSEFPDWPDHYKEGLKYVQGRCLDVGCGAGRICLHLQNLGREVVGIDNSPKAIEVCKLRGVTDARVCSITLISAELGTFDSILMMGNNFGLFGSYKRARWLLRRFRNLTSPQGRIITESNDPYQTDDPDHLEYHDFNRQRGRMSGQIRLRVRHRKHIGQWLDYLMVSKDEMTQILNGTGWQVTHFIDSEGSTYIAVIEKT